MDIFTTLDSENENTSGWFLNKKGIFEVHEDVNGENNVLWLFCNSDVRKADDPQFRATY